MTSLSSSVSSLPSSHSVSRLHSQDVLRNARKLSLPAVPQQQQQPPLSLQSNKEEAVAHISHSSSKSSGDGSTGQPLHTQLQGTIPEVPEAISATSELEMDVAVDTTVSDDGLPPKPSIVIPMAALPSPSPLQHLGPFPSPAPLPDVPFSSFCQQGAPALPPLPPPPPIAVSVPPPPAPSLSSSPLLVKPPGIVIQKPAAIVAEGGPQVEILKRRRNSWEKRKGTLFDASSRSRSSGTSNAEFSQSGSTTPSGAALGKRRHGRSKKRQRSGQSNKTEMEMKEFGARDSTQRTKHHRHPRRDQQRQQQTEGENEKAQPPLKDTSPDHSKMISSGRASSSRDGVSSSSVSADALTPNMNVTQSSGRHLEKMQSESQASHVSKPTLGAIGKFRSSCIGAMNTEGTTTPQLRVVVDYPSTARDATHTSAPSLGDASSHVVFRESGAFSGEDDDSCSSSTSSSFSSSSSTAFSHLFQAPSRMLPDTTTQGVNIGMHAPPASATTVALSNTVSRISTITLFVTLSGMSQLHADGAVVHPFVRVWLVNCVTGVNYVTSGAAVPCAITQPYDLRTRRTRSPRWEAEVALRIDRTAATGLPKDAVLLFEVLDCGNETIHGFFIPRSGLYPICWGFYMLHDCFGRETASGTYHDGAANIHLQMFRFPSRVPWYLGWLLPVLPHFISSAAVGAPTEYYLDPNGILRTFVNPAEHNAAATTDDNSPSSIADRSTMVPALYYIFKNPLNRKVPYEAGLIISLRTSECQAGAGSKHSGGGGGDAPCLPRFTPMHPYEEYLLNQLVSAGGCCAAPRRQQPQQSLLTGRESTYELPSALCRRARYGAGLPRLSMSIVNMEALGMDYFRRSEERVLPPTKTIQTCPIAGRVTCMMLSHSGATLALGVTRHLQYVVELVSPSAPEMPVMAQLVGHTAHIHGVSFQRDDKTLVSCSSDKTVRVWRPVNPTLSFSSVAEHEFLSDIICVWTLPHAYPVYDAIFHQGHILTCGYSNAILAWKSDNSMLGGAAGTSSPQSSTAAVVSDNERLGNPSSLSIGADHASTLRLTCSALQNGLSLSAGSPPYTTTTTTTGQMIGRVMNEESVVVLSLASNETSNRVWSVSSSGLVTCWRAIDEEQHSSRRGNVWQMSVRKTNDCSGATRVQVSGAFAIATCAAAPLVYIFDAASGEFSRAVNTAGLNPGAPFALLPDGLALVAATTDGRLHCWECVDGGLCTPAPGGYARVQTKYPIERISWADHQQLAAFCSPAPATTAMLNATLLPTLTFQNARTHGLTLGAVQPLDLSQMELTLISVVGTRRDGHNAILSADRHASQDFCRMFGGDVYAKQRVALESNREAALAVARSRKAGDSGGEHSRRTRLYEAPLGVGIASTPERHRPTMLVPQSSFVTVDAAATDMTEVTTRMNSILNFWRGLVSQHRHEDRRRSTQSYTKASGAADDDGEAHDRNSPVLTAAQRTVQYTDLDMPH